MSEQTRKPKDQGDARGKQRKGAAGEDHLGADVIIIKKYANRRLYNTATSSYVTLDFLSELVKEGQDFVVFDAKTGEDITRPVLTQIIFEQENKGQNLMPIQFLRQLIKFYGDSMQSYVPSYLEMSMDTFARNQEQFKNQLGSTLSGAPGYGIFEDSVRKNMALYEQAMKMFTAMPEAPGMSGFPYPGGANMRGSQSKTGPETSTDESQDIDEIKAQLAMLQEKLAKMEQ